MNVEDVCAWEDQPLNHIGQVTFLYVLIMLATRHLVTSMLRDMFSVLFMLSRTKAN